MLRYTRSRRAQRAPTLVELQKRAIGDVVEEYLDYQLRMEIFVAASAAAVRSDFRGLCRYLERNGCSQTLESFSTLRTGQYLADYRKKAKGATLKRWYKSFNGFGKWAADRQYLPNNPMTGVRLGFIPTDGTRRCLLTPTEAQRFLTVECRTNLLPEVDRAIRHLALFGGLRRNEYLKLKWKHFYSEQAELRIYDSKGSRRKGHSDLFDRIIPLSPPLLDALTHLRSTIPHEPEDPVLVTKRWKPLGKDAFYRAFNLIYQAMEPNQEMVPHSMRHSLAGNLLAIGATHADVAFLLGHRSSSPDGRPTTTDIYITSSVERVRAFLNRYADLVLSGQSVAGAGQAGARPVESRTEPGHAVVAPDPKLAPTPPAETLSPAQAAEAVLVWRSMFPGASLTGDDFKQFIQTLRQGQ